MSIIEAMMMAVVPSLAILLIICMVAVPFYIIISHWNKLPTWLHMILVPVLIFAYPFTIFTLVGWYATN